MSKSSFRLSSVVSPDDLSPVEFSKFEALKKEEDPEILGQHLLFTAGNLEKEGKAEEAAKIYTALLESDVFKLETSETTAIRTKAAQRWENLLGQGNLGGRLESLLHRFQRDSIDPRNILPMLAGSIVYGLMRGLALGRWASKAPGLWTRGSGLRLAASATGFMAEVPAFTLSGRALRWLDSSGPNQAPTSFGQDLLGAGLTIGLLKGFSALGREAVSRSPNFGRLLPHAQRAVGQGAALAGLMTAHSVEDKLGMRPHADISTMAMDALASMVSLGIGAQLGRKALGKSYSAWNDELNARIRIAEQNPGIASKPVLWFRNPLYAPLWSAMAAGGLGAGPSPRPVHSVSPEHPFQGRQIAFSRAKFLENHEGLGNNGWARDSFQIPFAEIAKNDFVKSFWPESVEALSPRNDPLSQKKIRVLVASSSELKVASARKAFQRLWPDAEILVEGAKAHSEINEQPYGLEETFKGAFNRLRNSRKLKTVPYDYYVAFENGIVPIEESGERFLDLAAIVIEDPNGLRTRALSGGVEFPSEMVLLARQRGFEQNTAGSLIAERFGCDPKDPHLYLTGNAVSRESLLIQGIELGLAQTERFSSSGGKPPKGKTRRLAEFASATVGGAISWLASKWPGGGKKGPEPVSKGSPP